MTNSSTKLLPRWKEILGNPALNEDNLPENLMPRDVTTCWNATGDMLNFAVLYKRPLWILMSDPGLGLSKQQLTSDEWDMAEELSHVLEVSLLTSVVYMLTFPYRYSRMLRNFSQEKLPTFRQSFHR